MFALPDIFITTSVQSGKKNLNSATKILFVFFFIFFAFGKQNYASQPTSAEWNRQGSNSITVILKILTLSN